MKGMRFALLQLLLASAWLGAAGPRDLAAQPVPLGPETQLPSYDFLNDICLAIQPNGDYVVAWDNDSDTRDSVYYHYVAAGTEPQFDGPTPIGWGPVDDYPAMASVTATPKGFDLLWYTPFRLDESNPPVFYRGHLDLQGNPDGERVALGGPGTDWVWQVRGNGFMAGWALPKKHGIAARRLTSSGKRTGPELRLNSRPVNAPKAVVLAVADGGFVAVWLGAEPGPNATSVLRARRFSPAGKPLGADFDVNTIPPGVGHRSPVLDANFKVAAAPGGGFAVSWLLGHTLYLRFFDTMGRSLGPQVPAVTDERTGYPLSMAFDTTGNLLLLWVQDPEDEDTNLQIQLFGPLGAPLSPPEGVNSAASNFYPVAWIGSVGWAGDSWIVAWIASVRDEDDNAVFVRRFAAR